MKSIIILTLIISIFSVHKKFHHFSNMDQFPFPDRNPANFNMYSNKKENDNDSNEEMSEQTSLEETPVNQFNNYPQKELEENDLNLPLMNNYNMEEIIPENVNPELDEPLNEEKDDFEEDNKFDFSGYDVKNNKKEEKEKNNNDFDKINIKYGFGRNKNNA